MENTLMTTQLIEIEQDGNVIGTIDVPGDLDDDTIGGEVDDWLAERSIKPAGVNWYRWGPVRCMRGSTNILDMTATEFNAIIFQGAGPGEHRGPGDVFSREEMAAILDSDACQHWPDTDRNWLLNTLDAYEVGRVGSRTPTRYYSRPIKQPKNREDGMRNFVQLIINEIEGGNHQEALLKAVDLLNDIGSAYRIK